MNSDIPLWLSLLPFEIGYWFFAVPTVLGLVVLALRGPKWLGRFRWVALGILAVPITIPLALFVMREASKLPLTRTLSRDEIVAGQLLYAGSVIRFRDWEHTYIDFIKLPRVTEIDGIPFTGTVSFASGGDTPGRWYGTLAADYPIDGWPCARGKIATRWGNKLLTCKLATARAFFDFEVPAETTVHGDWKSWSFELPPDQGLAIKALSATAPAGSKVVVKSDGRLTRIRLKEGQTMVVQGVPLRADVAIAEDVLVGEIAESFAVAGEQRAAGTKVSFDFAEPGWPCKEGKVRLPHDGSLWSCRLTSGHAFFGYGLPAGTTVLYGGARYTWLLILPPDKGLAIKAMSTTVPAGAVLWITDVGELWKIGGAGQSVLVHGVPLEGEIYISRGMVKGKGKIAESLEMAGKQQSIGTDVKIDLTTGAISLDPPPDCARVCPN